MISTVINGPCWPAVVDYLLNVLPALPGWAEVVVFDTDSVTTAGPTSYAIVVRSNETSGVYSRSVAPSGLIAETGTVRMLVGTRNGADATQARADGFALASALEVALLADHTLSGLLGEAGTVGLSVEVQSATNAAGASQSLVVSVNYTSLS